MALRHQSRRITTKEDTETAKRIASEHCREFIAGLPLKLTEVFQRDKIEPKLARGQRLRVRAELARYVDIASAKSIIAHCRDVKDNEFPSLALDARCRHG